MSLSRLICSGWLAFFLAVPFTGSADGLAVKLGEKGLESLRWKGSELLKNGDFSVVDAQFCDSSGKIITADPEKKETAFDAASETIKQTYPWGTVTCSYKPDSDRLDMVVGVQNNSKQILRGISLQLMDFDWPQIPKGWVLNFPHLVSNVGEPSVDVVDFGAGEVAVCNEEIERPLLLGFPGRLSVTERPLWVSSMNIGWLSPLLDSVICRPIAPGGQDHYRLSLRFASSGVAARNVAADIYQKFNEAYPFRLKWADRRPIGALFLCSHEAASPSNPRGWFYESLLDFQGEAGIAAFRTRLMRYAKDSIRIADHMGAQGVIVWDVEGEQFPHPVSYVGDPRFLPPEMHACVNEFFAKFAAAGLRVGVCLRPQRFVTDEHGAKAFQKAVNDPAATLIEKIAYARKQWGCTLFYIDSNGDPNVPMSADIFAKVAKAFPDVLLIPEHKNLRYYTMTAPYNSFVQRGVAQTPADVRSVYPQAFSVIYAPGGPIDQRKDELVSAVRDGDILMFHCWYDDPANRLLRAIYQQGRR